MAASKETTAKETTDETVTDVTELPELGDFDVTTLRGIGSWDDAVALLTDTYGTIDDASQVIGSGFELQQDMNRAKYLLVDMPFIVVRMSFPMSTKYKDESGEWAHYVAMHIITREGKKWVITDGGVGIYKQLDEYAVRSGRRGGLMVTGGLRASTYDLDDGSEGLTYYLNV